MEYKSLYLWGVEELKKAGVPENELDARYLLEFVCKTDRNTLLVHGDRKVSQKEEEEFRKCIEQRGKRIPLQHITGVQEFMGLEFLVDSRVLIPRQDTECLVEEAMRFLHDGDRILDLCTGSGCILLSLLHYSNCCSGVGVDLSKEALEVAQKNAERMKALSRFHPWEETTVTLLCSDLFQEISEKGFDMIVSNPPYIATKEIEGLMEEVKDHEPLMALDGREDGLYFYRRIITEGKEYLKKEGMMFFEIGFDQAEAVSRLMEENGYLEVTVVKDLAGLDRVVYGIRG